MGLRSGEQRSPLTSSLVVTLAAFALVTPRGGEPSHGTKRVMSGLRQSDAGRRGTGFGNIRKQRCTERLTASRTSSGIAPPSLRGYASVMCQCHSPDSKPSPRGAHRRRHWRSAAARASCWAASSGSASRSAVTPPLFFMFTERSFSRGTNAASSRRATQLRHVFVSWSVCCHSSASLLRRWALQ